MLNDHQDQPNQNAGIFQLEHEFLRYKLDILAVSEARWPGSGTVKTPSGHTVFLYAGNDEGADKTAGELLCISIQIESPFERLCKYHTRRTKSYNFFAER